jgi:hypothetical protein
MPHGLIKSLLCAATVAVPAAEAICAAWGPRQAAGSFVAAGFIHEDGSSLTVMCNTSTKLIAIVHEEPRANWKEGDAIDVTTRDEDGTGSSASRGLVVQPKTLVVRNESTFDLVTMGQATRFFIVSAGGYERIYPSANFKGATEPVLRACGVSATIPGLLEDAAVA